MAKPNRKVSSEQRRIEHLADEYLHYDRYEFKRRVASRDQMEFDEFSNALRLLKRSNEVLEFIRETDRDVYATFRRISELLYTAAHGIDHTRRILEETGFLDMLDDHFDTVMRGLDSRGLPKNEAEVLAMLGFDHLASMVHADVDLIAYEWKRESSYAAMMGRELRDAKPATYTFDAASRQIRHHAKEIDETTKERPEDQQDPPAPRRPRRWWKGVGQIVEGAALAAVDVGMAAGVLVFPVNPETQSYGAVISVTGGVGKMLNGVGDLRGE